MVEKSFLEIQGTFLVKIRDNTFNGTIRENEVEHIEKFLKVVGPFKIKGKGLYWVNNYLERFGRKVHTKFYQLSDDNDEIEADEDDNPDNISKIFKIEGNLFDFETPLCKAFNEFNYLLKIDTDLFNFDTHEIKTYEEYELNITGDLEEPWTDNGVPYQLCDHICEPYRFKNGMTK
nr:hypothetical protein [Tanacetum cinerariifolium]